MFTKAGGFCALLAVVPGGGEVEPYPSPSDTSPEERGEEAGIFFFFFLQPAPFPQCSCDAGKKEPGSCRGTWLRAVQ